MMAQVTDGSIAHMNTRNPPTHTGAGNQWTIPTSMGPLLELVQLVRATSRNRCWYSPVTGGPHQFVWVGYQVGEGGGKRRSSTSGGHPLMSAGCRCSSPFHHMHGNCLIAHPRLPVQVTTERFLLAWATFGASFSRWEPLVVTSAGTHCSLVAHNIKCGWAIS